jgi:outer membrane protein OmpA-like peptidoglycan-associated protein
MKKIVFFSFSIVVLVSVAFAQKDNSTKNSRNLLGIHLNSLDVYSPQIWKDNSGPRTLSGLKEQDLGFSVSYWKTISKNLDFSEKTSMMFHNYSAIDRNQYTTNINQVGFELEPTVNAYAFNDQSKFNAFITAGAGIGLYSNKFGAYIPTGLGLTANISNTTYFILQSQYRFTLSKDVMKNNLFYSIGIAQNITKEKPKVVIPPPPPPPVIVDRDNDGVLDTEDKCPDVAGSAKYQGCPIPDTDGDGLNDELDKCPAVAGTAKYQGCPIPDTDGDGINDEKDKCATIKGLARYQGCPIPDSDKDGVNDEDDKCPNVAGPESNQGCPEIEKAVIEKVNFAAKNIEYATGSVKLLPSSNKSLNEIAALMSADQSLKLEISGHSDNTGSIEKNKELSAQRATSVKEYIVSKGIDRTRINAIGYGSEKPIADNNTAAGRAKNRRTEMVVSNH